MLRARAPAPIRRRLQPAASLESVQITVRVKPGSRRGPLIEETDEGLVVHVKERAVDGAANEGVIRALAEHFGVPRRDVQILRGHTSRTKRVEVEQ